MKIWVFVCLILIFYSVNVLLRERYDLAYKLVKYGKEKKAIQYATCTRLSRLYEANETEFTFNQMKTDLKVYYKGLNFTNDDRKLITAQIKKKKYFIFRNFVCLIVNQIDMVRLIHRISKNEKCYALNIKRYVLYKFECQDSLVKQRIIQNKEYPYSKCKWDSPIRFKCIHDCIVKEKGQNLSKYYYEKDENGDRVVHLNFQNNQSVIDNEKSCLKNCERKGQNCKLIYFELKFDTDDHNSKTLFFKSYRLIRKFTFVLHFTGLFFLILNLSFNCLLSKPIGALKDEKFKRLKKHLDIFKTFALFVVLLVLCVQQIRNHIEKLNNLNKKEITTRLFSPEPMNLVFCFPLFPVTNLLDALHLENKRLIELENATSNLFNEYISGIHLEYKEKKIKIQWSLNRSKTLFREHRRCFLVHVKPYEVYYQSILSISKLVITFNSNYSQYYNIELGDFDLFLLSNSENFNSKSYRNNPRLSFVKREIKRSKTNLRKPCKDYKYGRIYEIDKCLMDAIVEEYGNISINYDLVIDKDHFKADKWKNLHFDFSLDYDSAFYNITRTECKQKYEISECTVAYFEADFFIEYKPDNMIELDIYYNTISQIEDQLSNYKLILELLNIQSILFNFNILELVLLSFSRITKLNIKFKTIFIYVICLIGLTSHVYFIFFQALFEDLIYSQYYELSESLNISDLIFCFETDQAQLIDPNHRLSYNYLEKITEELNFKNIFKEISYLNQSNHWISVNLTANFSNTFKINSFYFLNNKCFQIELDMTYRRDQFEFKEVDQNQVLRINFNLDYLANENSTHQHNYTNFFTKFKNTMQFSSLIELNYFSNYLVYSRLFDMEYYDKFNLLKNPMSIYGDFDLNDVNKYIKNLINNYKEKFSLRTLNLPIEKSGNDDLEIDDDLFEFYRQAKNKRDITKPIDLNFKRSIYSNYLDKNNQTIEYNFIFNLVFFKKVILITNQGSYSNILVNLLNVCSIWLGLCFLDLYVFVYKIRFVFIGLCKLLLAIEYQLLKCS